MTSSLVHSLWAFVFCLLLISLCRWADAMQTNRPFFTDAFCVGSRCYERQSLKLSWPFNKLRTSFCSADKLLVKLSPLECESVSPPSVMVNHPPTSSTPICPRHVIEISVSRLDKRAVFRQMLVYLKLYFSCSWRTNMGANLSVCQEHIVSVGDWCYQTCVWRMN